MIRKLVVILSLALLVPVNAYANYWAGKPVQCGTTQEIIDLVSKYGEMPLVHFEGNVATPDGNTTVSRFVIAINQENETWTLLEFTGPDQGCILGSGKGKILFPPSGITT